MSVIEFKNNVHHGRMVFEHLAIIGKGNFKRLKEVTSMISREYRR